MKPDGTPDQADREREEHTQLLRQIARNTDLLYARQPSWDRNRSHRWGLRVIRCMPAHTPDPRWRPLMQRTLITVIVLGIGALVIFGLGGVL